MIAAGHAFPVDTLKAKHCPSGTASAKQSCEEELAKIPTRYPGIESVEESKITPLFDAIGYSCYTGDDRNKVKEPAAECFALALKNDPPFIQGKAPNFTAGGKPADKRPVNYTAAASAVGITVDANTSPDTILRAVTVKVKPAEKTLKQSGSASFKTNTGTETNFAAELGSQNQFWISDSRRWLFGGDLGISYESFPRNFPQESAALAGVEWQDHMFMNDLTAALTLKCRFDEPEDESKPSTLDRTALAANLKCGNLQYGRHSSDPGFGCGAGVTLDLFYMLKDDANPAAPMVRIAKLGKLASFGATVYAMPWAVNTPFSLERNSAFELDAEGNPKDYAFFEGGYAFAFKLNALGRWAGKYGSLGLEGAVEGATPGSDFAKGKSKSSFKVSAKLPFELSKALEGLSGAVSASHKTRTSTNDAATEDTALGLGGELDLKLVAWGKGDGRWLGVKANGTQFFGGPAGAYVEKPAYDPFLGTVFTGGVPDPDVTSGNDLLMLRAGVYAKLTDFLTVDAGYEQLAWSRAQEPDVEDVIHAGSLILGAEW